MVVKTYNSYIADELANKVYHLTIALDQANQIIKKLEEENKNLSNLLQVDITNANHEELVLV